MSPARGDRRELLLGLGLVRQRVGGEAEVGGAAVVGAGLARLAGKKNKEKKTIQFISYTEYFFAPMGCDYYMEFR